MIKFNKKTNTLHLTNKSISYMIYINSIGHLEKIYLGKAIADIDNIDAIRQANVDNSSTEYYDYKQNKEFTFEDYYKSDIAPLEISTHGLFDKKGGPIVILKKNGSYETDFRYVSHKVYKGINPIQDMPYAHGEGFETVEFLLKETKYNIYLKYFISICMDKDIVVKNFEIINKSKQTVKILKALSMQLDLPECDYQLVHFKGRWAKERDYIISDICDGIQEVSSNYGRSSHEENPFVYIKKKDATNENGEVIGFNLIYSGNFKFRSYVDKYEGLHILYGMNEEDFTWILEPKKSFVTPQAVISYSYNGVDKMSQNFHRFIKENLITYQHENEYKQILFNSWEGCTFTFTTESIMSYMDDAVKIGSELFVLDDGWFGIRNDDYTGLGDWYVNKDKIDLHKAIDHCHKLGMKFGIWFEPEMINPYSDLFKEHPDYILGEDNTNLTMMRHQFHLDFACDEVVENIYQQMKAFLDEYHVDYIKWDYNRVVCEHFSKHFDAAHQGEIYHRLVLGYYKLISRIASENPDIMIEGCASGGGRFDMGTLFYTPQIWASDESDPIQRMFIQYNTSLGYPLSTIGSHVNNSKVTSYKTKAMLAFFGTYGYEMNPNKLTPSEMEEINEIAEIYRKYHASTIENGTLFHLSSPTETNFMSMQSVSKDKSQSVMIFMNKLKVGDVFRFIKLKGLDNKKQYWNSYDNMIHTGEYLMNIGLNLSRDWMDEFSCKLIVIEEKKLH